MKTQRKKSDIKEAAGSGLRPEPVKKPAEIKTQDIRQIAEPLCESEGIELVHLEYQREPGGRVLRLYIDKPGGITLDDCTHISRQLSDLLDVCTTMPETGYSLEVSSPGINRPLGKEIDFERFKGNTVKIRTANPIEGQKKFHGLLQGISEGMVCIKVNEKNIIVPFQEITKARLVKL